MAKIELENVWKRFGRVEAVVDLTLDIPDGSFIALLGPSGCGKTTTMNMLSGLLQPTSGEIRFNGEVVNDLHPGKRNVGFVFQNYAIFTHMSAFDNIAFGLRVVRKQPAETVEREVERVAELLDISHLLEQRAADLSVNDMQKVAIGRSMITNPGIFLLDEPFSNLDAAFRAYMRAEMKKLQRELRQTMIYVTHDQVEAMAMADHIAIMDLGKLQQYGTPDEVYNSPANRFVAHFVGSTTMNFLPAELGATDGSLELRLPIPEARPIVLEDGSAKLLDEKGERGHTLGIRPEHLELLDPANERADARGTVLLVEPLGARNIVHLRAGEIDFRVVVPPTIRPRVGDALGIELERKYVHVFDDMTGKALR
ncbi:MAG: ABC transporter ATP-binding protein [Thermoleophilia bacterium]|nr:ABC transporter ATP-binding protein [Thermoleophilia bacterium]